VSLIKRKKEAFVKARRLGRHKTIVEYKENKNKFKQGVRRAKRVTKIIWPRDGGKSQGILNIYKGQEGSQGVDTLEDR